MTPIYGLTEGGVKKTGRDVRVLPQDRDLRPRADADAAAGAVGDQRHSTRSRTPPKGCTRTDAQPDHRADGRGGHRARWRARCRRCMPTSTTATRARCAVRRLAVRRRARPRGDGAAPQAVPHAGRHASTCRMPRRTPWCCRMRWPTTRAAAPQAMARIARALGRADGGDPLSAARACTSWPRASARRPRCATSACRPTASTARPTSRCRRRTRTRARSSAPPLRALLQRAFDGAPPQT